MTRVKRGFISRRYHKKIIRNNKGYTGSHSKIFKVANQENMKALRYSYFDRKRKKGTFRKIWIKKINGSLKCTNKNKYNTFISRLKNLKVDINRKILAKISNRDEKTLIFILNFN